MNWLRTFFDFRTNLSEDFSGGIVKCIDSVDASLNEIEEKRVKSEQINEEKIVSIGRSLIKVTRKLDNSLGGMILNTYISCLLLSTMCLYATSTAFFIKEKNLAHAFMSCGFFFFTCLSATRLLHLTNSGEFLTSAMKRCVHTLTDIQMTTPQGRAYNTISLLKQDLIYHSNSPLNPCSAFSVSNSTLIGTFATILTYLIILIQFKTVEVQGENIFNNDKTPSNFSNITNV